MSASDKWLEFALRDIDGAEVLFEKGRYHLACYLSQQAAEKSLKAFLGFLNPFLDRCAHTAPSPFP